MKLIDKTLRSSMGKQLLLLLTVVITAFLALWVVARFFGKMDVTEYFFSFINPGSTRNSPESGFDKIWIHVIGISGMIFLSGLLISMFNNILQNRIDKVKNGQVFYKFNRHVIIIGYDKMAVGLISQICEKYGNDPVEIVLQTTRKVPDVRHEIRALLPAKIENRVTIVLGSRTADEDLAKLRPEHCREIFLLGETDEYDHDSVNIECLKQIGTILKRNETAPKRCHVLFEYQSTYAVFQRQDIPDIKDCIDFVPFNFYECWAQKVLVSGKYPFLDREPLTADSDKHIHFVVLGMSRMGVAMGIQAMHLCHFPNFVTKGIKTRITFIDENADREMNFLKGRYPHLFNEIDYFYQDVKTQTQWDNTKSKKKFTDIELEFIKGRAEHPDIQKMLGEWAKTENKLLTIAVCFNQPPVAIATGLYLPEEVYTRKISVFVRQETSDCTLSLLSQSVKYRHIQSFGTLDQAYDLETADDVLPMMVNYAYSYFFNLEPLRKLPDAFPEREMKNQWHELPTSLKWSNRFNANMLEFRIRSLTPKKSLSEQIDGIARVEHNRWCIEKLLMGYRQINDDDQTKGLTIKQLKNEYFIHTDICAFDDLPDDKKEIDKQLSKILDLLKSKK
jgi:hypothetical protein